MTWGRFGGASVLPCVDLGKSSREIDDRKPAPSLLLVIALAPLFSAGVGWAQTAPPVNHQVQEAPEIDVVGSSPLLGSGVDRDKIPAATNVLTSADVDRDGIPSLTNAITSTIPSASVNDTEGNPFQPDINFRGFTVSPVAGTSEGLAVYVNGARFNDAFGDTVNWDLIPSIAIDNINVEASNPVFGLNALGGSVSVRLKNGFNTHGGTATVYGGGYGRLSESIDYGVQVGNYAVYTATENIHDQGFRQTQETDIRRTFLDLGWRGDSAEFHLGLTAADNTLGNPGATPIQALDANISNIFSAPNTVTNHYVGLNFTGNVSVNAKTSLQTLAYYQYLSQYVPNGATIDAVPCNDGSGSLCNDDGTYATTANGAPIPDFLNGGPYSALVTQKLASRAYGGSVQVTNTNDVFGLGNHVVGGLSFDGSNSVFDGSTTIGGFDVNSREFIGPGVVVEDPSEGVNTVGVGTTTQYYGLYGQDILSLTPALDLSVAGRFNYAQENLDDLLGGPVSGRNTYYHLNPSAGLTYKVVPALQLYGSLSVTNRVPTPQELSCASAANPCSLLNFFVGDPPLKQVIATTFELGARGDLGQIGPGKVGWNADYYHTENRDDLIYETTDYNPNLAFYQNAGKTLRQGAELSLTYNAPGTRVSLGYAYTRATFETPLLLGSPSNPMSDENGNIQVVPGDRVPGIPLHRITATVEHDMTDKWLLGASAVWEGSQYAFGDAANLNRPIKGYTVVNLNTAYKVTDKITVFGLLDNVFNQRYYTYGSFGPVASLPWTNIPGGVTSNATASPGQPLSVYGGVKVEF